MARRSSRLSLRPGTTTWRTHRGTRFSPARGGEGLGLGPAAPGSTGGSLPRRGNFRSSSTRSVQSRTWAACFRSPAPEVSRAGVGPQPPSAGGRAPPRRGAWSRGSPPETVTPPLFPRSKPGTAGPSPPVPPGRTLCPRPGPRSLGCGSRRSAGGSPGGRLHTAARGRLPVPRDWRELTRPFTGDTWKVREMTSRCCSRESL